jgi:signal transduction histidine kinase
MSELIRDASRHRSVSALSRDIAHELKSILNVLGLNLALLTRVTGTAHPSPADLELAARSGDVMRRELKRLDGAIETVLQTQARDDAELQRIDLAACCERVGSLLAAKAARQRVTVRVLPADTEVLMDAYPAELQGAILNLAVNALQAMPRGGTLVIEVTADDDRARVRISDTGPGLSEPVLPDVWQPHPSDRRTGVGLAATKSVVDAHDGQIAYDRSPSDEGSSFTLEFPRFSTR